jgi:hypothetical protein
MARSTEVQKAERLNAAHSLLSRGVSLAEAVQSLSRDFGLSRRQAYRYLQEAQEIGHSVPVVEPSVAITLKMAGNIARDLRAYSVTSGLTLGEIVTRADRLSGDRPPAWLTGGRSQADIRFTSPTRSTACSRTNFSRSTRSSSPIVFGSSASLAE